MIRPTVSNRILSLDVLRGIAILGILLANIQSFAQPTAAVLMGLGQFDYSGTEEWVVALRSLLVSGKFRGMLAILFGVGLYLQYQKRKDQGKAWPFGYLTRTGWLILFGAIHAIFIWYGDILFLYGLTALLAVMFVRLTDKVLWICITVGFVITFLVGLLQAWSMGATTDAGFDLGIEMLTMSGEAQIYAEGTYLQQLSHRLVIFGLFLFSLLFLLPSTLSLFLFGILIGRHGVLAAPSKNGAWVKGILAVGLLAVFLNAVPLMIHASGTATVLDFNMMVDISFSMLMAPLYLLLGAIAVEKGSHGFFTRMLENVGRTAFSCYILQSILATVLFYSWGFGFFNQYDLVEQLAFVAGIWVVVIVFASLWLQRYQMGPLEWAWRSLSQKRKMPIKRQTEDAAPMPPPLMR
jgi:uncharacterized protein